MIFGKIFSSIMAQLNKLANAIAGRDPIAHMQYEYDLQLKKLEDARDAVETYASFVEKVTRQVNTGKGNVQTLEAKVKAYLKAGQRETAAQLALDLERAKQDLAQNEEQLGMHKTAYENNIKKLQHAQKEMVKLKDKIRKMDADIKLSSAEAEIARVTERLNVDIDLTSNFGQAQERAQEIIDKNRGKARVAADLSSKGIDKIQAEEALEQQLAEDALSRFEVELGIKTPESTPVVETPKNLGPATETQSQ